MRIESFCLCKAVTVNSVNAVSLIDIFDSKIAAGEPVLSDAFIAAALIRFYKKEPGTHRFQFRVRDQTGKLLVDSTEIVSIDNLATDSTIYCLQCQMGQVGLMFGTYQFSIESGGTLLASIPLYVIQGNR